MKQFLDILINRPFKSIEEKVYGEQGEKIFFPNEHSGTFTIVPEVIRRCHFLTSTEKEVLYELISWASTTKAYSDGYCKVTESHIRVNTTLGLSTVKKAISSLTKKGFIRKVVDFDGRNIYIINGASENPYIILSEWVHFFRKKMIDSMSEMLIEDTGEIFITDKKVVINATMIFVKEEKYYANSINAINELKNKIFGGKPYSNYSDEIEKTFDTVKDEIFKIIK
ncbi:hypothetical protein [Psychrobacillus sp. FSL K6-2843]|uniref:hypothetical protein n=1 Tax=Psychrobacillus sp. FSL K6-2843 TaxID=2921549 RepID=UPI00315A4C3F